MKKYILLLILFSGTSLAASGDQATLATVASNISNNIINTLGLVFNIAYLLGLVVFTSGLFLFYKNGNQPNQGHLKPAVVSVFVGAGLLMLPTIIETSLQTMFVSGSEGSIRNDSQFDPQL
jgi:hypothetical protein